mmetsp:Transcript_99079/g.222006  ORF Transcript_99079/g.222006 Transcript_99079/m.222006 type:complete len:276 (+) Transcript_99079:4538-5365(+)
MRHLARDAGRLAVHGAWSRRGPWRVLQPQQRHERHERRGALAGSSVRQPEPYLQEGPGSWRPQECGSRRDHGEVGPRRWRVHPRHGPPLPRYEPGGHAEVGQDLRERLLVLRHYQGRSSREQHAIVLLRHPAWQPARFVEAPAHQRVHKEGEQRDVGPHVPYGILHSRSQPVFPQDGSPEGCRDDHAAFHRRSQWQARDYEEGHPCRGEGFQDQQDGQGALRLHVDCWWFSRQVLVEVLPRQLWLRGHDHGYPRVGQGRNVERGSGWFAAWSSSC